ncbi:helix-turn-helix domain-containing protein, partial [Escherichia albertii]|nr:helix-turn-helix domain-containing protein [Escherichia albertii]
MSSKLHGLVWEGCAFTGMILSRVAVMARLADYSNDEGVSWPAVETIRRQIGAKSESTVKAAIAELEKSGWLTKEERKVGGRNVSNIYRLNVEKLEAAAAAAREAYKPKRKISPAKNDPLTVDPSNFDGSTVDKKRSVRGAMIDPDPSVLKSDPSDKRSSCPDASQSDPQTAEQDFLTR